MNKLVKAGIAAAAGIALLMGGAGTLAYWNASADLSAGTISSGHLTLKPVGVGAWDEDLDHIVPGDKVTYTGTYALSAVGDNLEVEVGATVPSVSGFDAITVTSTVTVDGDPIPAGDTVTLAAGEHPVIVSVVVDFPWGDADPGDEDQDETIALGDVEVTATQVQ